MNATLKALHALYARDLDQLAAELTAYKTDEEMWTVAGAIRNSGGNLFLHLCGNLQYFIGAVLGNSGYIRQRDQEFGRKGVSRSELRSSIDETRRVVLDTLANMEEHQLDAIYPLRVFDDREMTTIFFLIHLNGHLNYHLGQINYHRRLLEA